ncbi:hypothetical protein GCM10010983_52760 [Caulobacter rhizosphaerae]|jgi:hypothetical protein|nr:hypothetical protein ASD47_06265 [Caulobacter sp. Root1472]GGL48876.1 hypothetical protein GCM10010983_52760 [Caulobacter rhizosphaerae]
MKTRLKLVALVLLALAAFGALNLPAGNPIIPRDAVQVTVQVRSGDIVDVADPRIVKALLIAFGLLVLGVLAWVARHLHCRDRKPGA